MDWSSLLILLGIFLGTLISLVWLAINWWRIGVAADFYFGRGLIAQPLFVSMVLIIVEVLRTMFRDKPFDLWLLASVLAMVWALFLLLYTGGFIRGRFNRRRGDGIVGSKSW